MTISVVSQTARIPNSTRASLPGRNVSYGFVASMLASLVAFWAPLHRLLEFAATNSEFSYIPLIPAISTFLIVMRRHHIFADSNAHPSAGGVIVGVGILLLSLGEFVAELTPGNRLSLTALAIVATWWGLFVFCYGMQAARMALLPLCLLLFVIPPPQRAMSAVIIFLQHGSAVLSYSLFRMIGVPAVREGMVISLPRLTIEVAPECSGIRSSISLLILTLAGTNLYLRSGWNKFLLVSMLLPLALVKNAIRIVTLAALALYIDPQFLTGPLHHKGGILFFLLATAMLIPVFLLMQRSERRSVDYIRCSGLAKDGRDFATTTNSAVATSAADK